MGFLTMLEFLFCLQRLQKLGALYLYLIARVSVHQEAQDPENHTAHTHGTSALAHVFQGHSVWIYTWAFIFLSW